MTGDPDVRTKESSPPRAPLRRLPLEALLPIAIGGIGFVVDLSTPDSVAEGVLYVLAVLACVWVPGTRAAPIAAAALLMPLAVAFVASGSSLPWWEDAVDRVLGATAMWIAALVVWRNARLVQERDRQLGHLEGLHGVAERAASAERIDVSRWLHEGLAQELAAVGWGLDRLAGDPKSADDVRAEALELRTAVNRALDTVRGRAERLRDLESEPGSPLALQIEQYVATFRARTGLAVTINGLECVAQVPPTHVGVCFKLVQETLTNVDKHACASRVRIEFRFETRVLLASVTDDGCGLGADTPLKPHGVGLAGLAERVSAVGGALSIQNAVPHGVRIAARIPLP